MKHPHHLSADERRAALAGLSAYDERVAALLQAGTRSVQKICEYSSRARQLMRADARRRFREVEAQSNAALLAADFVPSLIELAQVEVYEETRYSLLLASLLDVGRSGPLALRFWAAFLELVVQRATSVQSPRVQSAVAEWTEERISRALVEPTRHASEWNNLDVFARVSDGEDYRCGLVIENKVNPSTAEQPEQLDRYWELIGNEHRQGHSRTLFVFLTEGPREMETAVLSRAWWVQLTWADIGRALWRIAEQDTLSLGHRLLALQIRDLVRLQVLGLPTLGADRRSLQKLRARLAGRGEEEEVWALHHTEILALWARTIGGKPS